MPATYDRVLIFPTQPMLKYLQTADLDKFRTVDRLCVAATRARHGVLEGQPGVQQALGVGHTPSLVPVSSLGDGVERRSSMHFNHDATIPGSLKATWRVTDVGRHRGGHGVGDVYEATARAVW